VIDFGFGVKFEAIQENHLEDLYNARNCELIRQWCRQYDEISPIEHRLWYERQATDPGIRMYTVWGKNLVGAAGLTSIDHINRRAEFSLYIFPEEQQAGYGRKALSTLLSHGFNNLNLNLIWGESFDGNPAISMFEKLGFVKEGTRREFYFKGGKYIDAHLYSIRSEEWMSRKF
jgi:[ribosomal protein S5]-alanine N-acetyltransferase